jgi:hypothetical protein
VYPNLVLELFYFGLLVNRRNFCDGALTNSRLIRIASHLDQYRDEDRYEHDSAKRIADGIEEKVKA